MNATLIGPGVLLTCASQRILDWKVPEAPAAPLDFGPSTGSVYLSLEETGAAGTDLSLLHFLRSRRECLL